ncbi:MAG: hypothetical protein R3D03_04570 [Geminicoccaceae bacterium]
MATGEISTGTVEMLISGDLAHVGEERAFRFVDFDQQQFDVNALQQLAGFTDQFVVPTTTRGAITRLTRWCPRRSEARWPFRFRPGISGDQVISVWWPSTPMSATCSAARSSRACPPTTPGAAVGLSGDAGGRITGRASACLQPHLQQYRGCIRRCAR